jgi:hypothetical protein
MGASAPVAGKANGLSTVVNVLTAPREAMESLRIAPTWGWAFLIAAILSCLGQYLLTPAVSHAMQASWPAQVAASPQLAGASPAQQQNALNISLAVLRWSWLFSPVILLINALIVTIVMLILKAIGRGQASFMQLWSAAMNVSVVSVGISSLVGGLISMVRGSSAYLNTSDVYRAVPSLAWLAPHAGVKVSAFLAAFSIISIWGAVLYAMAMIYVAKISPVLAGVGAAVILCVGGAFLAWGAR